MASILDMEGLYSLTEKDIDDNVQRKIGNYALGIASGEIFVVGYIGRSDTDLNQRIKDHLGEGYTHFKFSYSVDEISAYKKECRNYHTFIDFGKRLDNEIHPDKPKNAPESLKCPVCGH